MDIPKHLLFLAPFLLVVGGCGGESEPRTQEAAKQAEAGKTAKSLLDRSRAGSKAPTVEFLDPDGEKASLADFAGKPVLVNLWATWCAPCIAEMPTLDALAAREQGKLQVLALSQDMEGRAKVEAFFAEHRFKMLEPYLDPELGMMDALKVEILPTTILYDAAGKEVWRMTGVEEWNSDKAAALIAEASKG
ncbi:TlpA family protein disulfide reductase [Sphingosinicella rhizophila]|uniref:TlpA disulfide reductase family protein n=1 Tax=Sphingosinicella rhizophila TaxID=3050082 RepID=A0ABU3Q7X2_9SPHN|nr:TlpA disulfide reductase family protein [Sphingosinicella sp. GR2756]MDT9599476.1 TlpA disulfide reductase family protein [Sphingosinicella sp. GR2756]